MKVLRRLARWFAIALLVCLGAVVAGMVVATTPWFKDQVRALIVRRVGGLIEGELAIASLTGSLFGHATLHEVAVRQNGQPMLEVGALSVQYDIVQLVLGRFAIDEVVLRQPVVRLVETDIGWNVAHLVRPRERQPDSAAWAVAVRRLSIVDGHLMVDPLEQPAREMADLDLEGALAYTASQFEVTVDRLSVRDVGTGLRITQLAGEFTFADQEIHARQLLIQTPASLVTGHLSYRPGAPASLDAALELPRLTPAEFAGYAPVDTDPGLVFSGHLSASGSTRALRLTWELDSAAGATAGEITAGLDRPGLIQLDGSTRVARLNLAPLTGQSRLASSLTGQVHISGLVDRGTPEHSDLTFAVQAPEIRALGYSAQHIDARGSMADGVLRVSGQVRAYGAHATVSAAVTDVTDAQARRVSADGRIRGLNLALLPVQLRAPDIPTNLAGQYSIRFAPPQWRAQIVADGSQVRDATINPGTIVIAESRPGRFAAAIDGSVAGVDAALLGVEGRRVSLGGTVHARVALPGLRRPALHEIEADVTADLSGSTVEDVQLEFAEVDASLAEGVADVRRLELHATDMDISAAGTVAVAGADRPSNLEVQVAVTDLSRLKTVGADGLTGVLHLGATITGPADALTAEGKFNAHQVEYRDNLDALSVNGGFSAAVANQDWAAVTADVKLESSFLTVRGYDIQRATLASRYQSGRIDLAGRIEQTERAIELDGSVIAHPDHREIHVRRLTVAGATTPWALGGPGEAVINYGNETVRIEGLVFVRDQEHIQANGMLAFSGAEPSDLRVEFQNVEVGDLYTMAFGAPVVTGVASGDFRVAGMLPAPEVSGRLEVAGGQVAQVPYTRAAADIQFRDRRLGIDARIDEPTGSGVTVSGTIPIGAEGGALDVRAQSAGVSLGLAQAFTSHIAHVQGQAMVDLHATGPLAEPSLNGHVNVVGGGFQLTATGATYRDLNASLEFQGRRVVTNQFTLTDDDGHPLTMTAGADVFGGEGGRAFDVAIRADSLQVVENELGDVEVMIDVRAEGSVAAPRLTGRIAMDQGRLEVDELLRRVTSNRPGASSELRASLPSAQPAPGLAGPSETPTVGEGAQAVAAATAAAEAAAAVPQKDEGLFSRASMDLDIVIPDALVLRGQDVRAGAGSMALGNLNITIGGSIDLTKAPGVEPVIQGSLGVVRGFYEFQGRRFEVTRGSSVSFRGPDPANPALDVTGERNVQGVIARVAVTGTLRQPRLALSSDPPLDEGDVLSLIVFNQPINELGEAEQVDLLDRAGALAMGTIATTLSESLGDALDVDLFEIRAPGADAAGEVTVGRQVNDRLFIGFRQEFAGGEASRLSFEYQINDALRILTSVAQGVERAKRQRNQDTAGIDLIYQVRY